MTDVEFHLPISPTPRFFTMVHYFAASLRLNGGPHAESRIVVTVGADEEPRDLHAALPWSRRYPVEWHWLDRDIFRKDSYYATAVERFRMPFRAPVAILADADLILARPIDDLVERSVRTGAFSGLIAHVSPFPRDQYPNREWWSRLFAQAGLPCPRMSCRHTGWGALYWDLRRWRCPPYFNLGFLAAPAAVMNRIGETIYRDMGHVNELLTTIYRCQLGLALSLARHQIPHETLDLRYNFPNLSSMERKYRHLAKDARVLHYLALNGINKDRDFESSEHVAALLQRPLVGVERLFQRGLAQVHQQVQADFS